MPDLIYYDPDRTPGEEGARPDGATVRYVEPEEYYVALLGHVMNASVVFLGTRVAGQVEAERLLAVDDAIAGAYWDIYQGCLMPPRIRETLEQAAVGPSGQLLVEELESARREMFDTDRLEDAADIHASYRVQFLIQGADRYMTDYQVAVGELLTDYLLLQRAVAADVRRAERERKEGQARAHVLEKMDRAAELGFEKMLSRILRPQQVVNMIPQGRRADVESFARRRRQHFRRGLLVEEGASGGGDAT